MIQKGIYGDAKIKNAFKLAPGRSLNATKSMTQHMSKLKTISKAATRGSVVLIGVGLAASCYEISQSETLTEKNEIAVKTLTSTGVGLATAGIISIMLVGTPVGWGVLLLIGAGSAYASYKAGEVAGSVYKSNFSDVDIVNSLGISSVCN